MANMVYFDREGNKHFVWDAPLIEILTDQNQSRISSVLTPQNLSYLVDLHGTTLLHLAARYHSKFLITYLLNENMDVNAVNSFGETPLIMAVENDFDIDVWKALLDAGADLWEIKNNKGQSALTIIIQKYYLFPNAFELAVNEVEKRCVNITEVVDALLSADCQLYHLNIFKKVEITKLMLERGCVVNLQNSDYFQYTALHVAAKLNSLENVKVLLQFGADKNLKNLHNFPPIVIAFDHVNPDTELMKLLVPDDRNWMYKNNNMSTIFRKCSKEVLQFLLQHCNVNLDARDKDGCTPSYHLLWNHDTRIWELLENVNFNVNARYKYGFTLLHLAVLHSNLETVQFLLDAGANVNSLDKKGRPPLFYVVWVRQSLTGNRNCVELFMKYGANPQIVYHDGDTIVSCLTKNDRFYELLEPILLHLAMIETSGTTLNPTVLSHINANRVSKANFTKFVRYLDYMKRKTISGTVTYFKFLTENDEKIYQYVQNQDIIKELSKISSDNYFQRFLKRRLQQAMLTSRLRKIARQLINECIQSFRGYPLIVENIVLFLSTKDLKLIATSICTD